MSWIALWFALQVGLSPYSGMLVYNHAAEMRFAETWYTQFEAEVRLFDTAFIGGEVRTEARRHRGDELVFYPGLSSYGFTAGLRYGGMELGFLHACQHPTVPYYNQYRPVIAWDGWWTELYLRFSGDVGLGK